MLKYGLFTILLISFLFTKGQVNPDSTTRTNTPEAQKKYAQVITGLDSVGIYDQKYRSQLELIRYKYGGTSNEMKALFEKINYTDSLNLIYVQKVIRKYGWLDPRDVGENAVDVLFMVIQHSDLKSQKEFLPLMYSAAKTGKLKPAKLALLVDRIALREKRKQVYGSQIAWNLKENTYVVLPVKDPDNVDKRRAKVGLNSLSDYVKDCSNIEWNIENHKQESLKQTTYN